MRLECFTNCNYYRSSSLYSYRHDIFCLLIDLLATQHGKSKLKQNIAINLNESLLSKAGFYKQPCRVIDPRVYQNDTATTATRPQEDLPLRLWSGSLVMVPGVDSACYKLSQLVTLIVCQRESLDVTFLDPRICVCNCELELRTFEP